MRTQITVAYVDKEPLGPIKYVWYVYSVFVEEWEFVRIVGDRWSHVMMLFGVCVSCAYYEANRMFAEVFNWREMKWQNQPNIVISGSLLHARLFTGDQRPSALVVFITTFLYRQCSAKRTWDWRRLGGVDWACINILANCNGMASKWEV